LFIHWSLLLDIVAFGDHRLFSCTFYENADSICIDFVRLDWDLDLALGQGTKRHSARIRVTLFGGSLLWACCSRWFSCRYLHIGKIEM